MAGFRWQRYQSVFGGNLLVSGLLFGWLKLNFTAFANLPLWLSWILFARHQFRAARNGGRVFARVEDEHAAVLDAGPCGLCAEVGHRTVILLNLGMGG